MSGIQLKRPLETLLGLLQVLVLQSLRLAVVNSVLCLAFGNKAKLEMCLRVVLVDLLREHEVHLRLIQGSFVELSTGQVEVALGGLGVQLERQLVRSNRLLELTKHVVGISEIVEGGSVVGVEFDGLLVIFDGGLVVLTNAEGVTEIVVALGLRWV